MSEDLNITRIPPDASPREESGTGAQNQNATPDADVSAEVLDANREGLPTVTLDSVIQELAASDPRRFRVAVILKLIGHWSNERDRLYEKNATLREDNA